MAFRLIRASYDAGTDRAYVELRDNDDDGGEQTATVTFSYRTPSVLMTPEIEKEVLRKALDILRRAALTIVVNPD